MSATYQLKALLTAHWTGYGKAVLPMTAIAASGLPPSTVKHAAYWSTWNAVGKAIRALGWTPSFRAGYVVLTPGPSAWKPDGKAEAAALEAAKVAKQAAEDKIAVYNLALAFQAIAVQLVVGRRARLRETRLAEYEGVLTADDLRGYGIIIGWRDSDTVSILALDGALVLHANAAHIELEVA